MRSGVLSGMKRPSRRLSRAISSSRTASMRVLHQAPPPLATRLTRSPSRTPALRNWATAALARWPPARVRWMSSKRITNERPACDSRSRFVDTRGRGAGFSLATAGSCTASKSVMAWGSSSSVTWKSLLVRPVMDWPFLSVTTTSTVTTSTWVGKDALDATGATSAGASAGAAGVGEGAGVWADATVQVAAASKAISDEVFFITNPRFLAQAQGKVHLDRPAPEDYRPAPSPTNPSRQGGVDARQIRARSRAGTGRRRPRRLLPLRARERPDHHVQAAQ